MKRKIGMIRSRLKSSRFVDIRYLGDHRELIPVVAQWIFDEWPFLFPRKTLRNITALFRERVHKRKLPLTLVAFKGEKPVGTVSLKEFDLETRKDLTPWLTSLFVVKRWRGKGIGTALMKAAESKAAELGIHKLFLLTADSDLAFRFYSRLGWTIREKRHYHSYSIIIMEKRLITALAAAA
jgi:GNAT superfamily N-acetyltransferase